MNIASAFTNGSERPARWSLRLFGGFELSECIGGDRLASLGKRERILLAYLALNPTCRQPRRKLATLLWGDASEDTALDNLRTCLWSLRKTLGDTEHAFIISESDEIVLNAPAFAVDALAFRHLASQAGRTQLEAAAGLYTGEFLDGLFIESEEFESWRRAEAACFRDQIIDVLTRLMTQFIACGETERAIETGLRILRIDPLYEAVVRRLMRLYGENGRRGSAVQLYRSLADALRTELAVQPETDTRLVFEEITRGDEERLGVPDTAGVTHLLRSTSSMNDVAGGLPQPLTRKVFGMNPFLAVLASVLIILTALISFGQFTRMGATAEGRLPVVPEGAASATQAGPFSIAVLPFANVSGDVSQEFFSDGMTDEITAVLAKLPNLRVVGRTSAFQFKGEKKDLRAIGQNLGAAYLIDGSVLKIGNRVRVTAQLIQVSNGLNVWTDSYNRELADMFNIQEGIARDIAAALRIPLSLAAGETLVTDRTIDPESYEQYLRARTVLRSRNQPQVSGDRFAEAVRMLDQVTARDPDYAPAWRLLARMSSGDKQKFAAQQAIRLDPQSAGGYAVQAIIEAERGNPVAVEDLLKRSLAVDPTDPDVLDSLSNRLALAGRVKESLSIRQKLQTLEPFVPVYNYVTASIMLIQGQTAPAIQILEALPAGNAPRNVALARAYAIQGRYGEAADTLTAIKERQDSGQMGDAAQLLRGAPTKVGAPASLPAFDRELSFVYLYLGAPDRILDYQEKQIARYPNLGSAEVRYLWSAEFSPVRKTERFKTFVRKMGLVDYWRARGWPDRCRPLSADDFICA